MKEDPKHIYFPNDTYNTPESRSRVLADRFFMGSRWWFHYLFMKIVLKSRSLAVKGIYDDIQWAKKSWDVFQAIEKCGGRFHLRGLDTIRKSDEPVVFISNHMSTLETIIFPCIIAPMRPVTFVVKEILVKQKIFGPIMRSRDPIIVGRADPRRDLQVVLTEGQKILEQGQSIIIFPQSTRYRGIDHNKFNTLGVKLASRAGVNVIPVAIKTDFWGTGKYLKDLGPIDRKKPIHMKFGDEMTIRDNGKAEHIKIVDFIKNHLREWQTCP